MVTAKGMARKVKKRVSKASNKLAALPHNIKIEVNRLIEKSEKVMHRRLEALEKQLHHFNLASGKALSKGKGRKKSKAKVRPVAKKAGSRKASRKTARKGASRMKATKRSSKK